VEAPLPSLHSCASDALAERRKQFTN